MTDREKEDRPAAVSEATKQAGEIRARWAWVEPSAARMLTGSSGNLCVNSRPLRDGLKTPTILHGLSHIH